jgi:hypothetical protein
MGAPVVSVVLQPEFQESSAMAALIVLVAQSDLVSMAVTWRRFGIQLKPKTKTGFTCLLEVGSQSPVRTGGSVQLLVVCAVEQCGEEKKVLTHAVWGVLVNQTCVLEPHNECASAPFSVARGSCITHRVQICPRFTT